MCHDQTNTKEVNRLHEIYLRLIYNEKKSSFQDVLEKDGSGKKLAVELFKVFKRVSPVIFAEDFPVRQ